VLKHAPRTWSDGSHRCCQVLATIVVACLVAVLLAPVLAGASGACAAKGPVLRAMVAAIIINLQGASAVSCALYLQSLTLWRSPARKANTLSAASPCVHHRPHLPGPSVL
jgi:hypothetical protein